MCNLCTAKNDKHVQFPEHVSFNKSTNVLTADGQPWEAQSAPGPKPCTLGIVTRLTSVYSLQKTVVSQGPRNDVMRHKLLYLNMLYSFCIGVPWF